MRAGGAVADHGLRGRRTVARSAGGSERAPTSRRRPRGAFERKAGRGQAPGPRRVVRRRGYLDSLPAAVNVPDQSVTRRTSELEARPASRTPYSAPPVRPDGTTANSRLGEAHQ